MNRRRLLQVVAAGLGGLGGCGRSPARSTEDVTPAPVPSSEPGPTEDGETQRPPVNENCRVTQGLDVQWPEDITPSTVDDFVERYEAAYFREVVVDYEPESRYDSYDLWVRVTSVTQAGAGYLVEVEGGGAVYSPTLLLEVTRADGPPPVETVPLEDIDDVGVREFLRAFANSSDESRQRDVTDSADVDPFVDMFDSLPSEGSLEDRGDSTTIYVDVDGTLLALTVRITRFHGDYGWHATYYVDETVLRRTDSEDVESRDGELLECRSAG